MGHSTETQLYHACACCRRQAELLELQGLRATAASTAGLQERLQDSTATAAAMSASCQELQGALDDALARLAASSERCRQLEGRDSAAQQRCNMVVSLGWAGAASAACRNCMKAVLISMPHCNMVSLHVSFACAALHDGLTTML